MLIVLGAAGYVFWQRSQPPAAAPDAVETNVPRRPSPPGRTSRRTCRSRRAPTAPRRCPSDESLNGLAPPPEADAQTATPAQPQARPATPPRRPSRAPRQRIRKENSEVMEEFCADAGRNTPQCRRFRQSY